MFGLAGFAETNRQGPSGFIVGSCGHKNVEIHEILHTFGYKHVDSPNSIMSESEESVLHTLFNETSCLGSKKEIDKEIVDDLIATYK